MKKRIIGSLLAMTMAVTMLAGCGNGGSTAKEDGKPLDLSKYKVGDNYDISMLYSDNATYPYSEDWLVWDIFKKYTGGNVKVSSIPESDYDTKRQMEMVSGDVPDILTKTGPTSAGITDPTKTLLPVSDYLDQMPNFKAFVEKHNLMDELKKNSESDGKFYFFPVKIGDSRSQYHQWMLRTDLLKKHNLETPKTLDDLYNVAKKLKEEYPDTYPISNRFGSGNLISGIAAGFNTIGGFTIGNGMHYIEKDEKWVFAPTTDEWKNMIEYMVKLYKDGILDPEWTTMDSTVYEQNIVQGKNSIMYAWVGNQRTWNQQAKDKNPDYKVEVIMPPVGPNGDAAVEWISSWEQQWVLPSSLEKDPQHLAEVLHFVDWCYTDEAARLLTLGEEGQTCKKLEDGSYVYLDPTINYTSTQGLWNNCLNVRVYSAQPQTEEEKIDKESLDAIAALNCVKSPDPVSPLTPKQKEENSIKNADLISFITAQMESFICGDLTLEKDWDKFVSECNEKGATDLANQYNEAWKARKSK